MLPVLSPFPSIQDKRTNGCAFPSGTIPQSHRLPFQGPAFKHNSTQGSLSLVVPTNFSLPLFWLNYSPIFPSTRLRNGSRSARPLEIKHTIAKASGSPWPKITMNSKKRCSHRMDRMDTHNRTRRTRNIDRTDWTQRIQPIPRPVMTNTNFLNISPGRWVKAGNVYYFFHIACMLIFL